MRLDIIFLHGGTIITWENPSLLFERQIYHHSDGTRFAVDWYPHAPCNHHEIVAAEIVENGSNDINTLVVGHYLCGLGLSSDANVAQVFSQQWARRNKNSIMGILVPRGILFY